MRITYKNNSGELFIKSIFWFFGFMLLLPIPWVINDMIAYYSKGFEIK